MKKKFSAILLTFLLLLSLTACGSAGGASGGSSGAIDSASQNAYMETTPSFTGNDDAMPDGGWDLNAGTEAGEPDSPAGSSLPTNTKMIYSADIALETTEFDSAEQAISQIVGQLGGWFESRSIYQGGGYRNLRCTVRVPAQGFQAFLDQAGQAAHVTSRDEYAEDVSEVYYDNESRLATQRTKLERLQRLLSEATEMEDIIALETAISETELKIEHLTGSLRKYDSLVGYSTITLRLQEVYRLSSDEEPAITFGQRMGSAFTVGLARGISNLEEFCISLARNWFNLIIWGTVIAVVVLFLRWRWRKMNAPSHKPPQQPPETPKSKDPESKE